MSLAFSFERRKIMPNTMLKRLTVNANGSCELTAIYVQEFDDGSVRQTTIPRIQLPFPTDTMPVLSESYNMYKEPESSTITIGMGVILPILPNYKGKLWISEVIKSADPKEMTIEEIEAKLGHPVKIVKEKHNG